MYAHEHVNISIRVPTESTSLYTAITFDRELLQSFSLSHLLSFARSSLSLTRCSSSRKLHRLTLRLDDVARLLPSPLSFTPFLTPSGASFYLFFAAMSTTRARSNPLAGERRRRHRRVVVREERRDAAAATAAAATRAPLVRVWRWDSYCKISVGAQCRRRGVWGRTAATPVI